jgi:hypothetical protein
LVKTKPDDSVNIGDTDPLILTLNEEVLYVHDPSFIIADGLKLFAVGSVHPDCEKHRKYVMNNKLINKLIFTI